MKIPHPVAVSLTASFVVFSSKVNITVVKSVIKTVKNMKETHQTETQRRAEIKKNADLTVLAMQRAGSIIEKNIMLGKYHDMQEVQAAFATETEFQKIALIEG